MIFREFYTYCDVTIRHEMLTVLKKPQNIWCRNIWCIRKSNHISDCVFRSLWNSFWTTCGFHDFWPFFACTYCDVTIRHERLTVLTKLEDMWCRISWWIRKSNQILNCFFRSLRNSFWTACCFHDFWPFLATFGQNCHPYP